MLKFIKQTFIALLSFSVSSIAECVFLNNEPCLARPTLIELNPSELHFYEYKVSLDRYNGNHNTLGDFLRQILHQ